MRTTMRRGILTAVAAVVLGCVLGLYQATGAAPQAEQQPPFGNSLEQRQEQIVQLKEICELLKEQNALLREQNTLLHSGKLQVMVTLPEKSP
jgi:hypothetical protein